MNDRIVPPTETAATNGYDDPGIPPRVHLYDYLIQIARYRWMILSVVFGGTLLVALYSLVAPHVYPAGATLLPPDKSESINLASFLTSGEGFDMSTLGQNTSAEIFVKILKSRTLADSLIDRLHLMDRFDLDSASRQVAIMMVQGGFDVDADRQGVINIIYNGRTSFMPTVTEQRDVAQFAASMVNESIGLLDELNRAKLVTRARRSREFIGRMKTIKRAERDSIQERLLEFQVRNKAVALDRQVEASITALVEIQTQIQKKELEIQTALNDLNPDSKVVETLRSQLAQLRSQKARLEGGQAGGEAFALALRDVPELARQYATLKLDLEVATQVYTFLETQYNQEQVQEARDLPTISVLDWAEPALMRSSPRRGVMVIVAFLALSVVSLVLVFVIEAMRRYWRLNDSAKALELRDALRSKRKRRLMQKAG